MFMLAETRIWSPCQFNLNSTVTRDICLFDLAPSVSICVSCETGVVTAIVIGLLYPSILGNFQCHVSYFTAIKENPMHANCGLPLSNFRGNSLCCAHLPSVLPTYIICSKYPAVGLAITFIFVILVSFFSLLCRCQYYLQEYILYNLVLYVYKYSTVLCTSTVL